MRYIGLDVGDRTIGIAVSDQLLITAQGRETYRRDSIKKDVDYIVDYIAEEEITHIVVGLPKNMNGTIGPQGEKTQGFVKKLLKKLTYTDKIDKVPEVIYWDERLTSVAAEKFLISADVNRKKRKEVIDKLAAVNILQGYLDSL